MNAGPFSSCLFQLSGDKAHVLSREVLGRRGEELKGEKTPDGPGRLASWFNLHTTPLPFPHLVGQTLLKLLSIESVMPSNHLVLCHPLLLLLSIFPSAGGHAEVPDGQQQPGEDRHPRVQPFRQGHLLPAQNPHQPPAQRTH